MNQVCRRARGGSLMACLLCLLAAASLANHSVHPISSAVAVQAEGSAQPPIMLGATLVDATILVDGQGRTAVRAMSVKPGRAFGKAGVQDGDLIYSLWQPHGRWRYDFPVPYHLARFLFALPVGEEVRLEILRGGGRLTRTLKVDWTGDKDQRVSGQFLPLEEGCAFLAIPAEIVQIQDLPPKAWRNVTPADPLSEERRLPQGKGVVFVDPDRNSSFSKAGLRHGDIILALSSGRRGDPVYHIYGIDSAYNALRRLSSQNRLEVQYLRTDRHSGRARTRKASLRFHGRIYAFEIPPAPAPTAAPLPAERRSQPVVTPQTVTLSTDSVAILPTPVVAGQLFELTVRFRVADPAVSKERIPTRLRYRIMAGARTLLEQGPAVVDSFNGGVTEHALSIRAASQPGHYVVEVTLDYGTKRVTETAILVIE